MQIVNLYPILFEAEKQYTSYTPPNFALFQPDSESLSLVHVPALNRRLKEGLTSPEGPREVIAAMLSVKDSGDKCLTALQVEYVASSQFFPGAGITIYALASKHFGAPLTSDRKHSSSVAARETWAKIENSGEWNLAGTGLDNYAMTNNKKTYIDIKGTYPNRKVSWDKDNPEKPRTPEEIDDCPLPSKMGDAKDIMTMADLIGAANAYKYTGPLQPEPLIKHGQEVLRNLKNPANNKEKEDPLTIIVSLSEQLFDYRYKGPETIR